MNFDSHSEILQNWVMRHLFTDALENAQALLKRLREVEPFNVYVHERMPGILAALLVLFLISLGCVMGIVTLLPDMHWVFVLPLLIVLPVVLAGSLLTEVYVFFSVVNISGVCVNIRVIVASSCVSIFKGYRRVTII